MQLFFFNCLNYLLRGCICGEECMGSGKCQIPLKVISVFSCTVFYFFALYEFMSPEGNMKIY